MRYQALGIIALAATILAPSALAQSVTFTETGGANWTEANGVLTAGSASTGSLTTQQSYGRFELTFEVRAVTPGSDGFRLGTGLTVGLDCPEGTQSSSSYRNGFVFSEPPPSIPDLPGGVYSNVRFRLGIDVCAAASGAVRSTFDVSRDGIPGPWRWDPDVWYPFRMRVDDGEFLVELGGVCLICPGTIPTYIARGAASRGPGPVRFTYSPSSYVNMQRLVVEHGVLQIRNISFVQ